MLATTYHECYIIGALSGKDGRMVQLTEKEEESIQDQNLTIPFMTSDLLASPGRSIMQLKISVQGCIISSFLT